MYKKFLMLLLAFMISGMIFMSCSDDGDGGGTTPDPDPKLSITSPNGGEVLQMGSTVYIHFDNEIGGNVALYLYQAGDSVRVIEATTSAIDSVAWLIPAMTVNTDYQIKIVSIDNPSITDLSDANFAIAPAGDYIIVTSSDGGDIWEKGSSHEITWYDNIAGNVNILLLKDGITVLDIFGGAQASDGSQGWIIPNDLTIDASADYTIYIESIDNPGIWDQSDNFFCISEPTFTGNIVGDWNIAIFKQPALVYFNADGTWADSLYSGTWVMAGNGIRWDVVLPEDESDAYD